MANDVQSKAAELVKKALTVGVGAVFLTEESLRGLVSELKLPKEMITGLLETASKSKSEFFQKLSSDLTERLSLKLDPMSLITEFLDRNDVEFVVKVRVKAKNPSEQEE